jgi:preprotein translocase subunit SecB
MSADSCLQFDGYEVNTINFKLSNGVKENQEIQINPKLQIEVNEVANDSYRVKLSFTLESEENNELPFDMSIVMTGHFSFCAGETKEETELREKVMHENTVAIMFPFLRSIVASLTVTANIPPLVLPVINIVKAFENGVFEKND